MNTDAATFVIDKKTPEKLHFFGIFDRFFIFKLESERF